MQIGLLENDVATREMLCLLLQEANYNVTIYYTADECLKALRNDKHQQASPPIDLLIVDLRLSAEMSGTELIQQLRENSRLDTLPIILMTASAFTDTEELQRLNVILVEKPFDVDEIIKVIKDLTKPRSLY